MIFEQNVNTPGKEESFRAAGLRAASNISKVLAEVSHFSFKWDAGKVCVCRVCGYTTAVVLNLPGAAAL